jgi:uncharacterized protein (UPF0332 family)
MTLENWLANKWLQRHKTSSSEIAEILRMVQRDIGDARNESISADWRLNIAYNASLHCALAALFAAGFRTAGEGHHKRIIDSLKFTIKASDDLIRQLNRFRIKRNKVTYDLAGTTSEQEVKEAIELALYMDNQLKNWLRQNHPELYK